MKYTLNFWNLLNQKENIFVSISIKGKKKIDKIEKIKGKID